MKKIRSVFILLFASMSLLTGCTDSTSSNTNSNTDAYTEGGPTPMLINWKRDVTAADIDRIKWLEGTWRGTGEGQEPFYERYTFEGTTMTVESFTDASLKTVKDTTRYALMNGEFRHAKVGRRVAASEITDDHIQFVPLIGDEGSYRFERQPNGKWRAVLESPASGDKPAKQVIYNMEPYKK